MQQKGILQLDQYNKIRCPETVETNGLVTKQCWDKELIIGGIKDEIRAYLTLYAKINCGWIERVKYDNRKWGKKQFNTIQITSFLSQYMERIFERDKIN